MITPAALHAKVAEFIRRHDSDEFPVLQNSIGFTGMANDFRRDLESLLQLMLRLGEAQGAEAFKAQLRPLLEPKDVDANEKGG